MLVASIDADCTADIGVDIIRSDETVSTIPDNNDAVGNGVVNGVVLW